MSQKGECCSFFFFLKKGKAKTSLMCFRSGWFNSHRVDEDECFDRLDDVRILLPASFVENAINGSRWSRFNWTFNIEVDFRDREWLSGHYFHKRLLQIPSERRFLSLLTKLLPWTIRVCPKKNNIFSFTLWNASLHEMYSHTVCTWKFWTLPLSWFVRDGIRVITH